MGSQIHLCLLLESHLNATRRGASQLSTERCMSCRYRRVRPSYVGFLGESKTAESLATFSQQRFVRWKDLCISFLREIYHGFLLQLAASAGDRRRPVVLIVRKVDMRAGRFLRSAVRVNGHLAVQLRQVLLKFRILLLLFLFGLPWRAHFLVCHEQ